MPEATIDIATLQAGARGRLNALHVRRQTLAFESITDEDARAELDGVEVDIDATERELQRLALAAVEQDRRESVRLEVEEYERRRVALVEAAALQDDRQAAAQRIDEAAAAFFDAIVDYSATAREMAALLRSAGEKAGGDYASVNGYLVEAAFAHARMARYDELEGSDIHRRFNYVSSTEPLVEVEGRMSGALGIEGYIARLDASHAAAPEGDEPLEEGPRVDDTLLEDSSLWLEVGGQRAFRGTAAEMREALEAEPSSEGERHREEVSERHRLRQEDAERMDAELERDLAEREAAELAAANEIEAA